MDELHLLGAELSLDGRLVGVSDELLALAERSPDLSQNRRDLETPLQANMVLIFKPSVETPDGIIGDGEEGFARRERNDFDEVRAAFSQVLHGGSGFVGIGDRVLFRRLVPAAR